MTEAKLALGPIKIIQPRRLVIILIRPTKYDDDGYPLRFAWGVLPSNSSAAMYSLSLEAGRALQAAGQIESVEVVLFDDSIWSSRVANPAKLMRQYDDGQTLVVVGLVAVQTNQFPRACDLAHQFKALGAEVVIGGFHVSGTISTMADGISAGDKRRADIPCPGIMPPEVQALMDSGIVVCHGEAENIWQQILADLIAGEPKALYRGGQPALTDAPLPVYPNGYFKRFATTMSTFDTGRGCPFACSFCTIINVQGRDPRWRDPAKIIEMVKAEAIRRGQAVFFFTDDNFARNPYWAELLDGLIGLRQAGYRLSFMIEADLQSYKLPGFIDKLAAAGCSQVFLGMETVNQESLKAARKTQNRVDSYRQLCEQLHQAGIAVHVGYIIGFPADTSDSLKADIETIQELGVDQASFFILTPIPGSEDHIKQYVAKVAMDEDFNRYDSFHAVVDHPKMSREELEAILTESFRRFYTVSHMVAVLRRLPASVRPGMLRNFMWYRNSALGEKTHPMMAGFWSKRARLDRRPGFDPEPQFKFWAKEAWRRLKYAGHLIREFYIFQQVYFESKLEADWQQRLATDLRGIRGWLVATFFKPSRQWLNQFWLNYGRQKWHLLWKWHWHLKMLPHAATEVVYTCRFGGSLLLRRLLIQ